VTNHEGIAQIIHSRICEENIDECLEWGGRCAKAAAEIADAGFAVVRLPEPDPQGCYSAGGGTRVMVTSDGQITNGYAIRENATEARALAAALLAAAARIEVSQ
jgi:hypothetical protein